MIPHPVTEQPPPATGAPARALAPDLARGVMLLLIAIANSAWYLWGHPGGFTSAHPTDGSQWDRIARAIIAITIDGRVYPMFALLFAYGMVQFARSRAARGIQPRDIRRMLKRRHLAMLLLGFLHAALLFGGDILGAYAVLGLIFVPLLFEAKVKTLKLVLWILLAYAAVGAVSAIGGMLWLDSMGIDAAGGPQVGAEFTFPGLADLMSGFDNYLLAMAVRVGMWLIATPGVLLAGPSGLPALRLVARSTPGARTTRALSPPADHSRGGWHRDRLAHRPARGARPPRHPLHEPQPRDRVRQCQLCRRSGGRRRLCGTVRADRRDARAGPAS